MKISKKLVKRVFKVAFVMSLSLVFIQNNTKAMEGTLGTDSNYTIQDGTKDDYSFRTYNINLENSLDTSYYKYIFGNRNSYEMNANKDISGSFYNNRTGYSYTTTGIEAYAYGGGYANWASVIHDINADFIRNYLHKESALYNYYTFGGGLSNNSTINNITGDFIENHVDSIVYGRGGGLYNEGRIGDITSVFINNYVNAPDGAGGALYNSDSLGDINGNFIGNYIISPWVEDGALYGKHSSLSGGALYAGGQINTINANFYDNYVSSNFASTSGGAVASYGKIEKLNGDFIGNHADSYYYNSLGGAIVNGNNTLNVSGSFLNNYASTSQGLALGGAIYSTSNVDLSANNQKIILSGNYTQDNRGKIYNAIWMATNTSAPTLTLNAVNAGSIQFDDQIDGGKVNENKITRDGYQYNLKIQGDNTSKVILNNSVINANASLNDTNLYLSETAFSDENTNLNANSGTIHLANGKSENYQINQLTSLESANYTVDVDLTKTAPVPDTITTGAGSSGTVTISDINFNGELKDFNAQILKAQDDNIQLGLSDNLKDKYNTTSTETIHSSDTVQANVNWKDKFNKYEQTNTTTTGLSLSTTNTTNDSIEYSTKKIEGEKVASGSMGDTLKLVNQLQVQEERNFNFDSAEDKYNVTENLGQTSSGSLNINGIATNGSRSEVNLNSNSGFELANNSTLNINNTKLTGSETLIKVSNPDAVVNLQNSHIDGNISSTTEYGMNITGTANDTTVVSGNAGNAKATLTGSKLEFNSDTFKDASFNAQSGSINLQDEKTTDYNIKELTSTADTKYNFDIDLSGEKVLSDKLIVGNGSSGTVTVSSIDFINGAVPDKEFIVQLIDSDSNSIQLALDKEILGQNIELGTVSQTIYDTVTPTVKWNDIFNYYSQKGTNYGNIGLATTDNTNDSLALTITDTVWEDKVYQGVMGDTLALVNQLDTKEDRNFNFETSNDVYEVKSDLGTTSSGTININGVLAPVPSESNERSTINGNNHSLFKLDNATTLNLNNVKVTGANNVVTGTNKNAVVNINNSEISNNSEGIKTAGSVNISGNSVVENNGSGITVTSDTSVITLTGGMDSEITLRDRLTGVTGAKLNINRGTVNFEKKVSALDVIMEQANVNVASDDLFDENNMTVNSASNLNMANKAVGTMHLNNFTLNDNLNLAVDVDLANKSMDRITADSYNLGNNLVNVNQMNLLTSTDRNVTEILFADEGLRNNVTTSISEVAYSPIWKYGVVYDKDNGEFIFTRGGGTPDNPNPNPGISDAYNPAVMVSPVSSQLGGYMAMLDTYQNAFTHMDMYMLKPSTIRLAEQKANQYALTEALGIEYNSNEMNSKGMWYRPYASYDSVGLKNGPKVDNFSYGSFIGGDTEMFKTKHGFYGVVSPYIAYQGAHQSFSGNSIYQNGGTLGATATFYKGNFFTGLSAGFGMNISEASTMYGDENFPMLMAGIANKTGYNFEFKDGRYIIQPNLMLSYTFVNAFDYTNGAGVKINSEPLHAIQIAPNVRLIMNTKNGWQPYATFGMHWNIMDNTNVTANTTSLPELSIKPYFSYGLGIQRAFKDRFTAYAQIMLRNGGRNGIAASFGGRYMLGKETESDL